MMNHNVQDLLDQNDPDNSDSDPEGTLIHSKSMKDKQNVAGKAFMISGMQPREEGQTACLTCSCSPGM